MNADLKYYTFLFFIGLAGLASIIIPKTSFAATNLEEQKKARDGLTQEGLVRHQWSSTIFEGLFTLTGIEADQGDPTAQAEPGALQYASELAGSIYANPAASGIYYAQDILQNLGAKTAYAQGVGFEGLKPILKAWKAFRNVTYVLFTIVFVGVGLAIMLRIKISPQAVITIENAIPKIIGTLILVTFSYAIAGFLIDLMYVIMALGISILTSQGINPTFSAIEWPNWLPWVPWEATVGPRKVINWGFFALIPMFFSNKAGIKIIGGAIGGTIGIISGAISGGITAIPGGLGGAVVGVVLVQLIWSVIALILLFKLLFGLIKAYINIIISIIFSPFHIMLGAIPGLQVGGFGNWAKGLFTELMIFPAVAIIAIIGNYILQMPKLGKMWVAPLIGPPQLDLAGEWFPDLSGNLASLFIKTIIGMGFLLILARIPDIIRQAMKKESPYGAAIGEALGPLKMGGKIAGLAGISYGEQRIAAGKGIRDPTKGKFVGSVADMLRNQIGKS